MAFNFFTPRITELQQKIIFIGFICIEMKKNPNLVNFF